MKLSNIAVIFVVIAFVIIAVFSNYINLQRKTLIKQQEYDAKLIDSTKEAIEAFEINTVQWNEDYSANPDTKRRSVMGSINTFITTLANNMNISGSDREAMLSYIPAIAYTLYDGYYIYSPAEVKTTIRDDNGVLVTYKKELFDSPKKVEGPGYNSSYDGRILYETNGTADGKYIMNDGTKVAFTLDPDKAKTTYNHILKPYATYSERVEGKKLVINYTLDNYVSIFGDIVDADGTTTYISKSGFLTNPDKITGIAANNVSNIKFSGKSIKPELLQEQIATKDDDGTTDIQTYNYIYDENNLKVYLDEGNQPFTLDKDLHKVYSSEKTEKTYKKCVIPQKHSDKWTYVSVYQDLSDGRWYREDKVTLATGYSGLESGINSIKKDYSAINYCVESYIFTDWFNKMDNEAYLKISSTNDPEDENSAFTQHKKEVIKGVIESNLNQAITSYSRNTGGSNFYLPVLTELDWDQILHNVSIIAFLQEIPIGLKYYNNYTIAISTLNGEFVNPDEIYLVAQGDTYYHMPYCDKLEGTTNLVGYRNTDFIQRTDDPTKTYKNDTARKYYRHYDTDEKDINGASVLVNANQKCYYCLIERANYKEQDKTTAKQKAYYTALARERYITKKGNLPSQIETTYSITGQAYDSGTLVPGIVYINDEYSDTGLFSKQISKNLEDPNNKYEVFGASDELLPGSAELKSIGNLSGNTEQEIVTGAVYTNNANKPFDVAESKLGIKSSYKTDDKVTITVERYDISGVYATYEINSGSPEITTNGTINTTARTIEMGSDADGTINVKLNYTSNYNKNGATGATVWANINNDQELIIVTEPRDEDGKSITGMIRLKFTNGDKEYYSINTFDVEVGAIIACKIPDPDKSWRQSNWHVDILNTENKIISGGDATEYTFNTVKGLQDFAVATNDTSKQATTENRKFYLINDIDFGGSKIQPINGKANGFKGLFSGKDRKGTGDIHTLKNIKITKGSSNEYFGLFGNTENISEIKDLIINGITADLSEKDNVGGLVGTNNGGTINNITIENPTITGNNYVGGVLGKNNNGKVLNITEKNPVITGNDNVGGFAGESYKGRIENVTSIDSKTTGNDNVGGFLGNNSEGTVKNVTIKTPKNTKGVHCVGGFFGQNNGTLTSCKMEQGSESKVEGVKKVGGFIGQNNNSELKGLTNTVEVTGKCFVGGIVGSSSGNIINSTNKGKIVGLQSVSGYEGEEYYYGNIGGIVGYQTGGKIERCENNKDLSGFTNDSDTGICGIGGIVGKTNNSSIIECCNKAQVKGNQVIGGIAGYAKGATINSCFNSGVLTNEGLAPAPLIGTYKGNIMGGICGKASKCTIETSYNSGNVKGTNFYEDIENVFYKNSGPSGGIIGLVKNDGDTTINYCYNSGEVSGGNEWAWRTGSPDACIGGIVGRCQSDSKLKGTGNYCITENIKYSARKFGLISPSKDVPRGAVNGNDKSGFTSKTALQLRFVLYNWATLANGSGGLFKGSEYVYYTTAPVEADKPMGYNGFGVLYWQIKGKGYVRRTMYVQDDYGKPIYEPKLHIGTKEIQLYNENNSVIHDGKDIYGYTLMLKNNYDCYATASGYLSESNHENSSTDGIVLELERNVNFVLAIENNDANINNYGSDFIKDVYIPTGSYYIIAVGGRWLCCSSCWSRKTRRRCRRNYCRKTRFSKRKLYRWNRIWWKYIY